MKRQPTSGPIALAALMLALLAGCQEEAPPPQPLEIPFVTVQTQDVEIPLDVVGETLGSTDVTIRARVAGFLDGIHFEEGQFVDEGDLLYTIDPQPFQAEVAQAEAALAQARTELTKARSDLGRIRPLAEIKAMSAQDLDAAVAGEESARAFVDAAAAQVELANIELGYTRIHAPVHGLIGITQAEVGDFVSQQANGGLLNVVSRTDPTAVRVAITEEFYLRAAQEIAGAHHDGQPGGERARQTVTLLLADGSIYPFGGRLTKVDRNINAATGTLALEMEFENPDKILRPGLFARVRFIAERLDDAILLPQRAVSELQSDYRVFVIASDNTVQVRQVEVGPRLGSNRVILSGIGPGDRVAVAGLLRLRDGVTVVPRPAGPDDLPRTPGTSGP